MGKNKDCSQSEEAEALIKALERAFGPAVAGIALATFSAVSGIPEEELRHDPEALIRAMREALGDSAAEALLEILNRLAGKPLLLKKKEGSEE